MADTNVTPDDAGDEKRAIAKREWIDDKGNRVTTGSPDVAGARYTYLDTGRSIEYRFGQYPVLDRQFATMGALTKFGNVVNTATNTEGSNVDDPIANVEAWFAAAIKGEWREPSAEPRGPKYDKDILAAVLIGLLGAKAAGDIRHYRDKLDDKSYYAKTRANTKVLAAYAAEMEKRGGDAGNVDNLA